MAALLYYKFKSAKQFTEFPICGRYISVGEFKTLIFESKIGRGRDFDLIITNADTGEDYDDESAMILANTKLLLRRIPGLPPKAIVVGAPTAAAVPDESIRVEHPESADIIKDSEWNEIYATISGNNSSSSCSSTLTTVDDSVSLSNSGKIQTTVPRTEIIPKEIRKITVRYINPPIGYICHRCKVAGHFIQHCPTNGDPNYDIKRIKVASFPMEKEVKKMPSNVTNNNIPFEFYCKLCMQIMENSVMTKCCFASFCEKCIRNFISSNSKCICGVTNILNDHLLPNLTLRKTITGRMASNKNESKVLSTESSSNNKNEETRMAVSRAASKRKLYEHRNDVHVQDKFFKKFKIDDGQNCNNIYC